MEYQQNSSITADTEFIVSLFYLIEQKKERRILDVFSSTKYSILDGIAVSCEDALLTFIVNENGTIKLQSCEYVLSNTGKYYIVPCCYNADDLDKKKSKDEIDKKVEILIKSSKVKEAVPEKFITFSRGILVVPCKMQYILVALKEITKYKSKFIEKPTKEQQDRIEAHLAYRILSYKEKKQLPRGIEKFAFVYCVYNRIIPSSNNLQLLIRNCSDSEHWKDGYKSLILRGEWDTKTKEASTLPYDLYTLENCVLIDRLHSDITDSMCAKVAPSKIPIRCVLRKRLEFVNETFVGIFLSNSVLIRPIVTWGTEISRKKPKPTVCTDEENLVDNYKEEKGDEKPILLYLHKSIGISKQYKGRQIKLTPLSTPRISLRWHIEALRNYMTILFSYRMECNTIQTWCDTCNMKITRQRVLVKGGMNIKVDGIIVKVDKLGFTPHKHINIEEED